MDRRPFGTDHTRYTLSTPHYHVHSRVYLPGFHCMERTYDLAARPLGHWPRE